MKLGFALLLGVFYVVQTLQATTRYVDINCTTPVAPYTSWATAATNIQDAISASGTADMIWVNDGVYQFGSINYFGGSRLNTLGKYPTIQSVNGPEVTIIKGLTNSSSLVRCAYLTDRAVLSGFTLTNGNTQVGGGGVFCETANCIVTNCIIAGNADIGGVYGGGGVHGGTLLGCLLTNNVAEAFGGGGASNTLINCTLVANRAGYGGGAYRCSLTNCLLVANAASTAGGGAAYSSLDTCTASNNTATGYGGGLGYSSANNSLISSNRATASGGGAYLILGNVLNDCTLQTNYSASGGGGAYGSASYGSLTNCVVIGNVSLISGGGVSHLTLNNCVVTANTARYGAGMDYSVGDNCTVVANVAASSGFAAGAYFSTLKNSIIYYNLAATNADSFGSALTNCCTSSLANPAIVNSFTNEPAFVDPGGDFHLQSVSPCINAGNNVYATTVTDFDGNPRIVGETVDVGAYEYQHPASLISYAWLLQYGLPTDGSADYLDSDGDGMNNWQEWIAGTDPTDPTSLLQMYSAIPAQNSSSVTVSWESVSGKNYVLWRSPDLSAFSIAQTNIVGQAGTTSYKDVGAVGNGPFFYRVSVQ